jgi:hypothetical protein
VGSDAAGNLYFAGHFMGPINFGGTAGTFPPPTGGIAFTNSAENDVFLLKYSAAGNILWGRQISGPNLQEAKSIAVTPATHRQLTKQRPGPRGATLATTTRCLGSLQCMVERHLEHETPAPKLVQAAHPPDADENSAVA